MTADRERRDVEARLRASLHAYADVVGEQPADRSSASTAGRGPHRSPVRRWRTPALVAAAVLAVLGGVLFAAVDVRDPTSVAAPEAGRAEGGAEAATEPQPSAEDDSAEAAAAAPGDLLTVPSPVAVGVGYPFDLYTHCGVRGAEMGGRWFAAEPPLVGSGGGAPQGWQDPVQRGTLTLESADEAVFRDDVGHEVRLRAAPDSERPPACG